ncbi:MAG: type 4a pilus biogenesis protein PilO [Candidatus Saelkia tenebricola]|nr:type 4a pilus biogenesis protein PilO [Candidatus Saelkia tenebricola]
MTIKSIYHKLHVVIFPAALFVILSLFYNLVFKTNLSVIEKKIIDIEKKQKTIKLYGEKVKLETKLQQLVKKFPHSSDLGWLMSKITEMIKKEGMEIVSIQPLPVVSENFYKKLKIVLEVQGSYSQLGRMISAIDNSEYYFQIDNLTANPVYMHDEKDRMNAEAKDGNILLRWRVEVATIVPEI